MRGSIKEKICAIALLCSGVCSSFIALGQSGNDQMATNVPVRAYCPYSVEASGELIYPIGNFALRNNFGGVYSVHLSCQHSIAKGLYGGFEFQNHQLSEVTPVTFRVAIATTNQFFYNAGLKVSYYSSEQNDWFFTASVVGGESWMVFNSVKGIPEPKGGFNKQAIFFSPRICESLRVNDELRIGLEVSYYYVGYAFDPNYVGITQTYSSSQTSGATMFWGWGFSINYFLGKPKV